MYGYVLLVEGVKVCCWGMLPSTASSTFPPFPSMAVDEERLRLRKSEGAFNGTSQRQQKQAQGNP